MSDSFAALRATRLGQAFEDIVAFQAMDVFQIPLHIPKTSDHEDDAGRQYGCLGGERQNKREHSQMVLKLVPQNTEAVGVQTESEPPPVFDVLLVEATGQDEYEQKS